MPATTSRQCDSFTRWRDRFAPWRGSTRSIRRNQALKMVEVTQERWAEAEMHRLREPARYPDKNP